MIMQCYKIIETEFNDIEIKILEEAFKMCPPSIFPASSKDKSLRQHEDKVYRDDFMEFKDDLLLYTQHLDSMRFCEHEEMHDHEHNKGRGYNGKPVKLWKKDPQLILELLDYYTKNRKLEVKPDNLIDGIGQIYKQDVDKLYEEMKTVRDALNSWRIKKMGYYP